VFPLKDNLPTGRLPIITIVLIVANVIAYFFWQRGGITLGDPSSDHYMLNLIKFGAIPTELAHPGTHCAYAVVGAHQIDAGQVVCSGPRYPLTQPATWITPFTSMFMHGGLLHLGGNMLFLWIFGSSVETALGRIRFPIFYMLAGLAAMALQVAIDPGSTAPTIGASGAIAGVLAAYLILFPRARVMSFIFLILFFTLVEVPALVFLGVWIAQQIVFGIAGLSNPTGGGVAYFAHIGGFAFGLVAIKLFTMGRLVPSPPPSSPPAPVT
jgi:membrane associated rhomboid family serine protease